MHLGAVSSSRANSGFVHCHKHNTSYIYIYNKQTNTYATICTYIHIYISPILYNINRYEVKQYISKNIFINICLRTLVFRCLISYKQKLLKTYYILLYTNCISIGDYLKYRIEIHLL